ncbi:DUF3137 domain-containing protein [Paenibacillaceae bacterium]|nr:DUF3137 domain-containing protein [Paenibacillaceae bacterium]
MFPSRAHLEQLLLPSIERVEQARSSYRKVFGQGMLIVLLAVVLTVLIIMTGYAQAALITAIVAVITIVITGVIMYRKFNAYRDLFKDNIVRNIIRHLIEQCILPDETPEYEYKWNYEKNLGISNYHINECNLFNSRIDEISGEDLISGKLGLTDFEFSELKLVRIDTNWHGKGQRTKTRVTIFDGVLFVADFHKDFRGATMLLSRGFLGSGGFFNRIGNKVGNVFRSKSEKVRNVNLENDAFNRLFDTNTTDEVEARYILSANFMERLVTFAAQHPQQIEISFVGSKMFLALSCGNNYFEPDIRRPVKEQIGVIRGELVFFLELIELFSLNTRIWSK